MKSTHPDAVRAETPRGGLRARLAGTSLDLKLGLRMLVRHPGLTLVALLALAVAIGGGAAYLEVVNDVFRPALPFRDGGRMVGLYNHDAAAGAADRRVLHDFHIWRREMRTLDAVGAFRPLERNLITPDGRTEPVKGVEISADAFRVADVAPALGRALVPADERPGAPAVVVLGDRLWRARFASDPAVVGRTVRLGSEMHTVVGVMPPGFAFPVNHGMWAPLRVDPAAHARGEGPALTVFGRLAPGAGLDEARAELAALGARAAADHPATHAALRPRVMPYVESLWSAERDGTLAVRILYGINLFFLGLLAVCGANVATLVFARAATREGELAVRGALGATRGRIAAQFVAEALVLAVAGAAVGLTAAWLGLRWMAGTLTAAGADLPFWWNDALSPATLAYAGVLALLTACLVGLVPARKATAAGLQGRLKRAAAPGAGMRFGGLWTGIIVTQVALTVVFLLVVVSVGWNVHVGRYGTPGFAFSPDAYVSARVEMDGAADGGGGEEFRARFGAAAAELERRLRAEPGVEDVTWAAALPGMHHPWVRLEVEGAGAAGAVHAVRAGRVAPGYFDAFGAPVVSGRAFDRVDVEAGRAVAMVDQRFVRRVLGGRAPAGLRVREWRGREAPGPWVEVVGVARDLSPDVEGSALAPVLYRAAAPGDLYPAQVAVRVGGGAAALAPRLRAVAAGVDPGLRLYDAAPMTEIGADGRVVAGMLARVLALVGAVALLLSAAGVYALMSFTVTRRTREIGIRVAVGGTPRRVMAGVLRPAFAQVALGIAAGAVPGALLVAWGLPEVARGAGAAGGAAAFAAIAAFMLAVTLLACALPARRALRVQPTEALRAA